MAYGIPSGLAWVADQVDENGAPALYLMHVPDGEPLVLTGIAAVIWLFAAQGDDVVAELAEVVGDPPPDLAETTAAYLDDLVSRGLLVREGEEATA